MAHAVPRTLATRAVQSPLGAAWPAVVPGSSRSMPCQHCHGAPGMVTSFANASFSTPRLEALLLQSQELTWSAEALAKGSNLCHSIGGNGYALLKPHKRAGDPLWPERASVRHDGHRPGPGRPGRVQT